MTGRGVGVRVLDPAEWRPLEAAHGERVDALAAAHLDRRRQGRKHPVEDFLWTYYSLRPAQLRRWHPGPGLVLAASPERAGWRHYQTDEVGTELDRPSYLTDRGDAVRFVRDLLRNTLSRPASWSCFGLHEWAMVYRTPPEQVRHAAWPLRLGAEGTDAVVEANALRCTHFDAFRFFTPDAAGRNALVPTRAGQAELEQPGCLHATMDCYKWAYTLGAGVPGSLLLDAFDLARDARQLDMRAAPYDLAALGYQPIRIETPEGKAEYVAAQRAIAERGAVLRRRLVDVCEALLAD